MNITNIILWTISLLLATMGIVFGVIASINASKTNKKTSEILSDQIISVNANKFFFIFQKSINTSNKSTIRKLESQSEITFSEYSLFSSKTRFAIIPKRMEKHFQNSEFKELVNLYQDNKKNLEDIFVNIFNDFSLLSQNKKIPANVKDEIMKYHKILQSKNIQIMKLYNSIIKKDGI